MINCGDHNHDKEECRNKTVCTNCVRANAKFNINVSTDHSIFN